MSFALNITPRDWERLRLIVRKVHKHYRPEEYLENSRVDMIIEFLAPLTREKLLKDLVDREMVDAKGVFDEP